MKVIVADKISDRGVQLLKEQPGWNVVMTSKDSLNAEIADADALIVRSATKVTAELLDRGEKLRAVGRAGVGVDNIDLDEATKRGVLVMSTPGGSSVSVAEHTFALLLRLFVSSQNLMLPCARAGGKNPRRAPKCAGRPWGSLGSAASAAR